MAGSRIIVAGAFLLGSGVPVAARGGFLRSHSANVARAAGDGHPVEDVIKMLQKLGAKSEEEGKAEALTYQKFEYWCSTSGKELQIAIAGEKESIESLTDLIDSKTEDIEVLSKEIDQLSDELLDLQKSDGVTEKIRKSGAGLYEAESEALRGTIAGIGAALETLESARTNTDTDLIQRQVRTVLALVGTSATASQRRSLESFVSDPREPVEAAGDYEAHVKKYSFKSSGVIELLKSLRSKFEGDLLSTNNAETNALNEYDLATNARKDLRTAATDSKQVKEASKGAAEEELIAAKQARDNQQKDLEADQGTFDTTTKSCQIKASEWAERSKVRSNEMEAIEAAVAILAKATGVRTEAPSNPVPPASPVSLIQISSPSSIKHAMELLRKEGQVSHSKAISQLAQAIEASKDGPFDKVVNSIEKIIFRLMNEQKEEDDHKNWCDKELSKTNAFIVDQDDKIKEFTTKINDAAARAANMKSDIQAANEKVSEIEGHVKEAMEIRRIGKEENALAVKDAEAAQTALTQAISVLKDFYKQSGEMQKESWEFIQSIEPVQLSETPSTWDSPYTAVSSPQAQPGGIVTVLEAVSADFSKMESDTLAQEETDQGMYEEDMKSCDIEKARRIKEAEMKEQEMKRVNEKKVSMEATRKGVSGEKEATEQYLKDLQPACVKGDSSYEDRKAGRTGEVKALKTAQDYLEGAFDKATTKTE